MEWVYTKTEERLWTVGYYAPDDSWFTDSDHGDTASAAARVAELNGGKAVPVIDYPTAILRKERDALAERVETLEAAMSEACLRLDASGICRVRVVPAMDILHKALEAGQSVPV